jgi:hypothetical protein
VGAIEHCKVEFMQEYRLFEFSIAWVDSRDSRGEAAVYTPVEINLAEEAEEEILG